MLEDVLQAEERLNAAMRLDVEDAVAEHEDHSQSEYSDQSVSDVDDDAKGCKRALGHHSSLRRQRRRTCQYVPYLSMLEPATPYDFPLLLSPLSSLPDRTAAVDYSEQEIHQTGSMPPDLRKWENERIVLYNFESTTRQLTGVLRVQKDFLKDSQRQLQETRQVAIGVDEQLHAAQREVTALVSSRRRGARAGLSRGAPPRGVRGRGGRRVSKR